MTSANRINFVDSLPSNFALSRRSSESLLARWARRIPSHAWKYILVASDTILILVGFVLAYYLRYQLQWFLAVDPINYQEIGSYLPFAGLLVLILLLSYRFSGVYPYVLGQALFEEVYKIASATIAGGIVLLAITTAWGGLSSSRLIFLYTVVLVTLLLGCSRMVIYWLRMHVHRYGIGVKHILLVGVGDLGRMVMRTIAARPDCGYQLVGFLDDNPARSSTDIGSFRALGPIDNFAQVIDTFVQHELPGTPNLLDTVIICLPWQSHRLIQRLLRICEQNHIHAQVVPDFFQLTKSQLQVDVLDGIPLLSTRDVSLQGFNLALKRITDLSAVLVSSPFVLPIAALIALAIKLDSPGPVIYKQTRIGKNGKPFCCYKFRSMIANAEERRQELADLNEASGPLFKVRNDPRQTGVGRFLRRSSLDELPQLINVLRGEMSWIGPRPNLPAEVERYEEWHKKRLLITPGITGLWQVSGRSDLTFDEMVLLDIYYVENWSLSLDLSIVLRSIPAVLRAKGAY